MAAALHRKINGRNRTEIDADATTFTADGVNLKLLADGIEAAEIEAGTATGTTIQIDKCFAAAHKIGALLNFGLHQQMEIGSIDIRITQDAVFRQSGKSRGQAGFAGTAFAANNHYFAHETASLF
jgi:hypothetical protein